MTWFRIDDTWLTHPKVQAVGLRGRALWIAGGLHCAQHLTDGLIDKTFVTVLAATAGVTAKEAKALADAGLWIDRGTHWEMKDFLDYQPSRESVLKERERWARSKRKSRHRDSDRPSDEESTVDSYVESRSESTPSRPDPTRSSSCASPPPTTTRATGAARLVVEVTKAITAARLERQQDREIIENDDAYQAGIERNVRAELGERIITTVNDNPDAPTDRLVTLVLGDYEGAA